MEPLSGKHERGYKYPISWGEGFISTYGIHTIDSMWSLTLSGKSLYVRFIFNVKTKN